MPNEWISKRLDDVASLYTSPDPETAREILDKYDVQYVYVGELEQSYYPAAGLEKFERMRADGSLSLVYHNERVKIYSVVG
jgi:uncharacterized membrane protein